MDAFRRAGEPSRGMMLEDLTNRASDATYNILNVKIAQNYVTIVFVLVNLDN